ncbi:MAG TPA: PDZ domain-containing protein [Chlorobaculum sp.]|nr:PDZ domain-containing protein [Chlorobaculum sp.]
MLALVFMLIGGRVHAAEPVRQLAYWGIYTGEAGGQGVAVQGVEAPSPAKAAGLQSGDVLVSIGGLAVHSLQEFRALKNSFPLYTPLAIKVSRGGAVQERQIELAGFRPLEVKPVTNSFVIPGVPAQQTERPLSAVEALDTINVLDKVVLDPSGEIAVIGHYDPRFNTGPIPYLDLLKTAMIYPRPLFNLINSPEINRTLASLRARGRTIEQVVLGHPDAEQDRQLFLREWASLCGVAPQELVTLYNYVKFAAREPLPPSNIRVIQSRILVNLGFSTEAQAYDLITGGDPEGAAKALRLLGHESEVSAILAKKNGGDAAKARGELTVAAYLAILERIYVPKATVAQLRSTAGMGQAGWQELAARAQGELLPARSGSDSRELVQVALSKVMLTPRATQAIYANPFSGQTLLMPVDIDRTSQLARILYEADFCLKSTMVMPQLFRQIPGSSTQMEYLMRKGQINLTDATATDFWMSPKQVALEVSTDRRVVSFGNVEMSYNSRTHPAQGPDVGQGEIEHLYDDWCAVLINNYDDYARILPAFHKVREAAKITALANWLLDRNVKVDLREVKQEKWEAPLAIGGFWRAGNVYWKEVGGSYNAATLFAYSGGISLKSAEQWTKWSAVPVETKVTDQLTLSAGLGQKAVQAAQSGNLEQARHLAELSAQAMNGSLSKSDLVRQNIPLPDFKPIPATPANVRLQKELLKKTSQHLQGGPGTGLVQVGSVYDQLQANPVAASDFLTKLQTGQTMPPQPPPIRQQTADEQLTGSLCGESSLGADTMPENRREYMLRNLGEAKERLKHINEALKKLIAINTADRAELDNLTASVEKDFEAAKERAYAFATTTLVDLPLARYGQEYEGKIGPMENEIKGLIGRSTTPMGDEARKALEKEIRDKMVLKVRYEESFGINKHLLDIYGMGGNGRDLYEWWESKSKEDGAWQKGLEGAATVGQLLIDNPAMSPFLEKQQWFGGNKVWQVLAMGKMAAYASGFFWDVMDLSLAWGPQAARMRKELQVNNQALDDLRQKSEKTMRQINCWERLLK